jgi:NAD(P)-dependent dehydrogenase (short-subunit alcohol dehydrogenase family)
MTGGRAFDLTGRVALITGAGGLLGPQHAIALAELGAAVALTDLALERARQAVERVRAEIPGARLAAIALDVTDRESVRAAEAAARASLGPVDILVNNAAIDPKVEDSGAPIDSSRLEAFPLEQWRLQIDVGLTGAMLCAQVFGTAMAARGRGVILNVASDLGVIAPDQRLYRRDDVAEELRQPVKPVTYSVVKHGLIGLTRYLATYWAERGVRCNAISPGGVFNGQPRDFVDRLERLIPLGRMATIAEYRGAVQFLCSDASAYLNGHNLVMDGGRSVW